MNTPWFDETTAVAGPREDPRGIDDEDDELDLDDFDAADDDEANE
jgi:hypothetical protein